MIEKRVFATTEIKDDELNLRLYATPSEDVYEMFFGDEIKRFADIDQMIQFFRGIGYFAAAVTARFSRAGFHDELLKQFEEKGELLIAQETAKDQQRGVETVKNSFPGLQVDPATGTLKRATAVLGPR